MSTPLILDGKTLAKSTEALLSARVAQIKQNNGNRTPILATILVGSDPASATYVRMKGNACRRVGMDSMKVEMSEETTTIELESELQAIADQLDGLTLLQASRLVKALEDKWGVSAAAPAAVAMVAPGGAAAEEEEKTSFDVILVACGDKKIQVIKEIRSITGLGLKEAKELVEGAPKVIKEGVPKDEAAEIQKKIEGAGGQVDVK